MARVRRGAPRPATGAGWGTAARRSPPAHASSHCSTANQAPASQEQQGCRPEGWRRGSGSPPRQTAAAWAAPPRHHRRPGGARNGPALRRGETGQARRESTQQRHQKRTHWRTRRRTADAMQAAGAAASLLRPAVRRLPSAPQRGTLTISAMRACAACAAALACRCCRACRMRSRSCRGSEARGLGGRPRWVEWSVPTC